MRERQVPSLGWEGAPEKEMVILSSIRAWGIPGTEEPGGLQSMGWQRVDITYGACMHGICKILVTL